MKDLKVPASLYWLVSLLLIALACHRKPAESRPEAVPEMPRPGVENPQQADSLKKALDEQRRQRIKQGN